MIEEDVLRVLKQKCVWMFAAEIAIELDSSRMAIRGALKTLFKKKKIERRDGIIRKRIVHQWRFK